MTGTWPARPAPATCLCGGQPVRLHCLAAVQLVGRGCNPAQAWRLHACLSTRNTPPLCCAAACCLEERAVTCCSMLRASADGRAGNGLKLGAYWMLAAWQLVAWEAGRTEWLLVEWTRLRLCAIYGPWGATEAAFAPAREVVTLSLRVRVQVATSWPVHEFTCPAYMGTQVGRAPGGRSAAAETHKAVNVPDKRVSARLLPCRPAPGHIRRRHKSLRGGYCRRCSASQRASARHLCFHEARKPPPRN